MGAFSDFSNLNEKQKTHNTTHNPNMSWFESRTRVESSWPFLEQFVDRDGATKVEVVHCQTLGGLWGGRLPQHKRGDGPFDRLLVVVAGALLQARLLDWLAYLLVLKRLWNENDDETRKE